jgi:hypothetical protein
VFDDTCRTPEIARIGEASRKARITPASISSGTR